MKRALQYRAYRNAKPFEAPDGIVSVEIDPESGMPATPFCPKTKSEVFIAGTQPVGTCPLHGGQSPGATHVAGWELPAPPQLAQNGAPANPADPRFRQAPPAAAPPGAKPDAARAQDQKQQKRKGFFHRLMDVFK